MADEWKPLPIGEQVTFTIKHPGTIVAYDGVAGQYTIATGPTNSPDRLVKVNVEDVDSNAI